MKTPLKIITVLVLALSIGLFVLSILFRYWRILYQHHIEPAGGFVPNCR